MTLRGRSFRFSALSLSKMVEKTLLDPAALLDLDSVVVAAQTGVSKSNY